MMYLMQIDEAGYIEIPEIGYKKSWGAIVYRRGKKIKIASFLPRERSGGKIGVSGLPRDVYLTFGSTGEKGSARSVFVVENITGTEISLRPVEESTVPSIYDIDTIAPLKIYILEARQVMLEAQVDELRRDILDLKK